MINTLANSICLGVLRRMDLVLATGCHEKKDKLSRIQRKSSRDREASLAYSPRLTTATTSNFSVKIAP